MAITESTEIIIEASPEEILDVINDIESLPEWSDPHKSVEVLERDEQGRPLKSKSILKLVGIADEQVLTYTYTENSVRWNLVSSKAQKSQEAGYAVFPEGEDKTRVTFDVTIEPAVPMPGFVLKKATKFSMNMATEGLRKRVLQVKKGK